MKYKQVIKKGMLALPLVLLIVLMLTLFFYGALYAIKTKNKVNNVIYLVLKEPSTLQFEDGVRFDSFAVDAILLDESCSIKVYNKQESFIYALLDHQEKTRELKECMSGYLDSMENSPITYFKIYYPNKEEIFYYQGKKSSKLKETYNEKIYLPEGTIIIIEVGYA